MNYSALIQNRKSVREYAGRKIPDSATKQIKAYYENECRCLVPSIKTELLIYGDEVKESLESAAGYEEFMIGAPGYMILLSEDAAYAGENAGFIMEDLILKLTDMDLGSCWLTFTDGERVARALGIESDLKVAAIAACGYAVKARKKLRINIFSMSNVDISAKRRFFDPKLGVGDLVYIDEWGKSEGLDEYIGFYDDMLWEALYAVTLAPSYLNRQPYRFIIHEGTLTLVRKEDEHTRETDERLGLGVVLLHFAAVASEWAGDIVWSLGEDIGSCTLPEGCRAVAECRL